jgi:hypothetical protein
MADPEVRHVVMCFVVADITRVTQNAVLHIFSSARNCRKQLKFGIESAELSHLPHGDAYHFLGLVIESL